MFLYELLYSTNNTWSKAINFFFNFYSIFRDTFIYEINVTYLMTFPTFVFIEAHIYIFNLYFIGIFYFTTNY